MSAGEGDGRCEWQKGYENMGVICTIPSLNGNENSLFQSEVQVQDLAQQTHSQERSCDYESLDCRLKAVTLHTQFSV